MLAYGTLTVRRLTVQNVNERKKNGTQSKTIFDRSVRLHLRRSHVRVRHVVPTPGSVSTMPPRKKLGKRERTARARRSRHNSHLKEAYGITIQDYDKLLEAQGGRCAICKGGTSKRHFAVDHNHKNGNVRGLLCARCNTGLARFMDNITNLRRAVRYMKADGEKVREVLDESNS